MTRQLIAIMTQTQTTQRLLITIMTQTQTNQKLLLGKVEIELTTTPKISAAQQQVAKKIVKKHKSLKTKGQPIIYAKTNKKNKEDDVVFIKKVPVHLRDRLARAIKKKEQE